MCSRSHSFIAVSTRACSEKIACTRAITAAATSTPGIRNGTRSGSGMRGTRGKIRGTGLGFGTRGVRRGGLIFGLVRLTGGRGRCGIFGAGAAPKIIAQLIPKAGIG